MRFRRFLALSLVVGPALLVTGLSTAEQSSRRTALQWLATSATAAVVWRPIANGAEELPDSFDVESYIKSGMVSSPMGVSGQAGKSKPETGVVIRDGSDVLREPTSGFVSAEILLKSDKGKDMVPVLATYASPWPLATGTVFDVECRDASNGDGAFLAVSSDTGGLALADLKDSFFVSGLIKPTGRFSSYGEPTDVKINKSSTKGAYRVFDLSFSTLAQSTNMEIPRRARVIATIPAGTKQAVMLVGSASALRWKKGSEQQIESVVESFRAVPAPQTSLKVRAKERRQSV